MRAMFKTDAAVHNNATPNVVQMGTIPVRQDVSHANHQGEQKAGQRKNTEKLVNKLAPAIGRFLEPGEVVLYIARVQAPANVLEQLTWGWYLYYVTATVLVFTNQRILHLRVDSGHQWTRGTKSVAWRDVSKAEVKGWLSKQLKLTYADGSSMTYWKLRGADAKVLKVLLPVLKNAYATEVGTTRMAALCPECKGTMPAKTYACMSCGLLFKNERTMMLLALVPGGAYIYCRRWFLAILDILGEGYSLLLFFAAIMLGIAAVTHQLGEDGQPIPMEAALLILVIALIVFGIDVAVTIHHCQRLVRDHISADKYNQQRSQLKGMAAASSQVK